MLVFLLAHIIVPLIKC